MGEDLVAAFVAVLVIYPLEIVDVEREEGERLTAPLGDLDLARERGVETAAIRQACQVVGKRGELQFGHLQQIAGGQARQLDAGEDERGSEQIDDGIHDRGGVECGREEAMESHIDTQRDHHGQQPRHGEPRVA